MRHNFQPARRLVSARPTPNAPPHASGPPGRRSPAQAAGLRYERHALRMLARQFPSTLVPKQWFEFRCRGERFNRHVEVDAFSIDFRTGVISIFEIKLRHTPRAWAQLALLYEPIISFAFGPLFTTRLCEVVRWYDPATECPVPAVLTRDLLVLRPNTFHVHILP